MTRTLRASGAVILGAALAMVASPAFADVTNPADNPHKITVTGDDGKTYVDGQDTLPGFDDEACTYIPGAWFDFENNRVRYPDGQSIPWTEWERATGYQDWLASKQAAAPAPAPQPQAGGATSGGAGTSGTTGAGTATAAGATVAPSAAASAEPSPSASPTASASAEPSAQAVATNEAALPGASTEAVGEGDSAVGLAILGALFGIGGALFGGYTFLRRGARARTTS